MDVGTGTHRIAYRSQIVILLHDLLQPDDGLMRHRGSEVLREIIAQIIQLRPLEMSVSLDDIRCKNQKGLQEIGLLITVNTYRRSATAPYKVVLEL